MYVIYNLIIHKWFSWLCGLAFLYAAVTLWSIHTDLQATLALGEIGDWQQPITTQALFPYSISAQQWHFDFEATEKILVKLRREDSEKRLLNPELLTVLTRAVNALPNNMNEKALNRAVFLVSKGLSAVSGKQMAGLFKNYYQLKQASFIDEELNENVKLTDKRSRFKAAVIRQNRYLGEEVANQLYGKQRAITAYIYERQSINQNLSLKPKQKQKQLNTLKIQYKNRLKTIPYAGLSRG